MVTCIIPLTKLKQRLLAKFGISRRSRINYDLDIYQLHCTCAKLDKTSKDNFYRIFYVIL